MNEKESFFKINLDLLRKRNTQLADRLATVQVPETYTVLRARNGQKVLKVNNITFHSTYNPEQEGMHFIATHSKKNPVTPDKKIVIFGLGFGYHLRAIAETDMQACVVEPDICIMRLAMEHCDLRTIIERMDFHVGSDYAALNTDDLVLWHHAPSVQHSKKAYEYLLHKKVMPAAQNDVMPGRLKQRLKIVVVSPIYGGSLPVARYCARALQKLGHEVHLWDASIFEKPFSEVLKLKLDEKNKKVLYDLFLHLISEMVVATCGDVRPDLMLGLAQAPISLHALERLKQSKITTAFWFVEDYRFMEYWRKYAPAYDFYFTIQDGIFFDELARIGVENYSYLPMAADTETHCPLRLTDDEKRNLGSDLSFMGSGYYNRQKMFSGLLDFDLKIWGTDWDIRSPLWKCVQRGGDRILTEETVKIFNAALINVNLHSSAYHEGIHPYGDFVNPRTFEIAACEAFQLVDYRQALERHFDVGKELICYRSLEELRDLARYYLRNPGQRAMVGRCGRERVLREHTYMHRMRQLSAFIQERRPECFYHKASRTLEVRDVVSFCRKFPEVRPILDEVTARGWNADIDSIVAAIRERSGQLQYPEALFMIMKEYQALIQEHLH